MGKRKQAEHMEGVDRLAKINADKEALSSIKTRCTKMINKSEWSVTDLTGFIAGVCRSVGVSLNGAK